MYTCAVGESLEGKLFSFLFIHFIMVTFINYLFNYLPWSFLYLFLLTFYSPSVHFSGGGECKDPSHFLFSSFVYWIFYCHITWMYLAIQPIDRGIVQLGLKGIGSFTAADSSPSSSSLASSLTRSIFNTHIIVRHILHIFWHVLSEPSSSFNSFA